jgi:hypothetical protein
MERALLRRSSDAPCRCNLCLSMIRPTDAESMALVLAQRINAHGPMCGTDFVPCVQCEELMRSLALKGVEALREQAGCELSWRTEGADLVAAEQATLYFRFIEPGRVALWDLPVWMSDVADIGDTVRARAEREIYESAKSGGKG